MFPEFIYMFLRKLFCFYVISLSQAKNKIRLANSKTRHYDEDSHC